MVPWRLLGLGLGMALLLSAVACGETAQDSYARGKALLAQGEFERALAAFTSAARADQSNREYLEQYSLARRLVLLRQRLETEQDPDRWAYLARSLHALYCGEGMFSAAIPVAEKIHARLNDESSAVVLAETQLAVNRNAEAAGVLRALDKQKATASSRALLGVALARQGDVQAAREIVKDVGLGQDTPPQARYAAARLYALTGYSAQAVAALAACFESVPPSRQANLKEHANRCPDFAALASTAEFAKVLETPSKVPESACSGGSGCGACPMRGNCAKAQSGRLTGASSDIAA